jgi:DNA-directed RNA polymerase specialized sigma24 family protein
MFLLVTGASGAGKSTARRSVAQLLTREIACRSHTSEIENLGGWLITVVLRVSLNMLRSRETRSEEPLGPHMPDPVVNPEDGADPEHEALLADSVGLALLVVLETLTPTGSGCRRARPSFGCSPPCS